MRILERFLKGATRRVLTGKTGPRCYYKGKRCTPAGFLTNKSYFLIDRNRLHEFIVPDLSGFPLKPYVDASSLPNDMKDEDFPKGKMDSNMFLQLSSKCGNEYDAAKAEPYDWLVNVPEEVMREVKSKRYVPNPHHKALEKKPHGKLKPIANREFLPYRHHN